MQEGEQDSLGHLNVYAIEDHINRRWDPRSALTLESYAQLWPDVEGRSWFLVLSLILNAFSRPVKL